MYEQNTEQQQIFSFTKSVQVIKCSYGQMS